MEYRDPNHGLEELVPALVSLFDLHRGVEEKRYPLGPSFPPAAPPRRPLRPLDGIVLNSFLGYIRMVIHSRWVQ